MFKYLSFSAVNMYIAIHANTHLKKLLYSCEDAGPA